MKSTEKKPSYNDDDDDIMPFGKYKGNLLQDVPVSYLHWIYHNINCGNDLSLKHYIENNIDSLKMENKDLIWTLQK